MTAAPLKILAVDDEQLLLCALQRACRGRALDFRTAASVEEALARIDDGHYDLFLLDFDLKDQRQQELLAAIDRRCPYVPVILMTTCDETSSALQAAIRSIRRQGPWHLLEKPFSLERMIRFIDMTFADRGTALLNPLAHHYDSDKRRHSRRPHVQPVHFAYNCIADGAARRIASRGILTDLGDGGAGMLTHEQLPPGQMICFENDTPSTAGVVTWSVPLEPETFRCGIRFS